MIYNNDGLYEALLGIEPEAKSIQINFLNKLIRKTGLHKYKALEIMSGVKSQFKDFLDFPKVDIADYLLGTDITNPDHVHKLGEYEVIYGLHNTAQAILYNGVPSYNGVKKAIKNLMDISPNLILHIDQGRDIRRHYLDLVLKEEPQLILEYEYIVDSQGAFKGLPIKYDFKKSYTRHSGVSSLYYSDIYIDGHKQEDTIFDQLQLGGNSIKDICDELNFDATFYYDSFRVTSFYEAANFVHIKRRPAVPRKLHCYIDYKYRVLTVNELIDKLQTAESINSLNRKSTVFQEWVTDLQIACLNERYNRYLMFYDKNLLPDETFVQHIPQSCFFD